MNIFGMSEMDLIKGMGHTSSFGWEGGGPEPEWLYLTEDELDELVYGWREDENPTERT